MEHRRRQSDLEISERVAVIEVQHLQIGIMLNEIKRDVHKIAESANAGDNKLADRVDALEKTKDKLIGGWFALTLFCSFLTAIVTLYLKSK